MVTVKAPTSSLSPGGGHAAGDHAAALFATMPQLAAVLTDTARWPTGQRRAVLADMDHAIDGLGAVRAGLLVAERMSGAWRREGHPSFEACRGRTSHGGQRTATVQARAAEQLDVVPDVAAAVTEGRTGMDHAAMIAKVGRTGTAAVRARGAMARVGYDFHEPNGHLIGTPPPPTSRPTPPAAPPPPAQPHDDLDFTPTLNPLTGMTVPAYVMAF